MSNDLEKIFCFNPIVDANSKILILGTMPSVTSIEQKMYYASSKNHFWDFIYRILKPGYPPYAVFDQFTSKEERYGLLKTNGIAVWDIISSCKRQGSNDNKIREESYNDILTFVKKHRISAIFCNGGETYKFLKKSKQLKDLTIPVDVLNSSSSLNSNNTFKILDEWMDKLKRNLNVND